MRTLLNGTAILVAMLWAISHAHGQKATEQYIPIGQSPGVSQKYSSIGEIADVNAAARTVTIADRGGPRTVRITDKTRIWLDRTKLKQTNLSGSFADLQKGRRVEVKYEDPARRDVADWVKVEVVQP
ncbi:MAG TPA: hypothetical protein VLD36_23315 [Burkholderiales bacterium]|jgi:hypothetical protein|nr:hypothetical protein [Burkholderiales bacterium]